MVPAHCQRTVVPRVNHGFGVSVGVRMLKSTEIRQECMSAGRRPAAGK
jgi:hypothetical protein